MSEFVLHEGQICRKVESYEAVDVAQLASKVEADQAALDAHKNVHADLQAQLDAKDIEVQDAESVLEDSKRSVDAAQALVGEASDNESDATDEATDGASGEVDDSVPQPII